jgi:host factor-I protein
METSELAQRMTDKPLSLQDQFLNGVRRSKAPATVFLVKGVKLQGVITWFDAFSLLLRRDSTSQLIYKHAISTIMPVRPPAIDLQDFVAASGGARASLQDAFLAATARERAPMTLFLVNGVMLQGHVAGFDQFCVVLERDEQMQLVYKHAISTLQPPHPLEIGDQNASNGGDE